PLAAGQPRLGRLERPTLAAGAGNPRPRPPARCLHGRFDERHTLLLDNRLRNGQAGVEVLQPFYDQASGLWLLVNRGWVAWSDRRSPPALETPDRVLLLDA
ncbi:SURF1 family cytochrome oxidase biogenesis protein, partial [Pseudomonas aeruginosa]